MPLTESLEASVGTWPTSGADTEPYMYKYSWKSSPTLGPHTLLRVPRVTAELHRAEWCIYVSWISLGWILSKSGYVTFPTFLWGTPEPFFWISRGPAEVPCHSSHHDQYLSYGCVGRTGSYPLLPAGQTSLPRKPGYKLQNYHYVFFPKPPKWFHRLAVQPGSLKCQHRRHLEQYLSCHRRHHHKCIKFVGRMRLGRTMHVLENRIINQN